MFPHCFLHRILMSVVADEKQVLSGQPLMDSRKVSDAFHFCFRQILLVSFRRIHLRKAWLETDQQEKLVAVRATDEDLNQGRDSKVGEESINCQSIKEV